MKPLKEFRELQIYFKGRNAWDNSLPGPIRNTTLSITYRCNARCSMCRIWEHPSADPESELTLQEIEKIANSKYFKKLIALGITGGEPFIREDLPAIVEIWDKTSGFSYMSLATNGLLPERIEKLVPGILEKTKREIWLNVSIDALDERHDEIRGVPGALDKADETLNVLKDISRKYSNLNLGILYTMMPENIDQLMPVYQLANNNSIQFTMNVLNQGEIYYCNQGLKPKTVYEPYLDKIKKQFDAWRKADPNNTFASEMRNLFFEYIEGPANKPVIPCYSGFTSVFISPLGEVYPCVPASQGLFMGNIREQEFDDIWESENAKKVRDMIKEGCCKCLITCETANSLKFQPDYLRRRLKGFFR